MTLGPGTSGTPAATATYPQGTVVNYAYAVADSCYQDLAVHARRRVRARLGHRHHERGPQRSSASASLKTFTIESSAGTGGSISPPGTTAVSCGGSQTYAIAPLPFYYIADVQVDGASVGAVPSYTFSDVRADHTIAATFSAVPNHTLGRHARRGRHRERPPPPPPSPRATPSIYSVLGHRPVLPPSHS